MRKITAPQEEILRSLAQSRGSLARSWLSVPCRRLATRMEQMGLVVWTPISTTNGGLRLDITEAGRAALAEVKLC